MTKPHLTIYIRVKITLILIIAVVFASFSQNSIGIGTVTPQQSAILDVYSTHKGFLPPRMTEDQMDVINSPSEGLIVYCLDCNPKGIYVRSGNEFKMTQFFAKPVEYLNIDDVSITRGTTSFNIFPTLIPNEATVDYELIRNPIEGIMEGTRINISPDLAIGEYNITVKAIGKDNYNGKTGATFKLNITRIPLTGLSIADVSIPTGTTLFVISPALTPSEATAGYSLIDPPTGIYISETTINIPANMFPRRYDITVKATGNGNYNGETEATFWLYVISSHSTDVAGFIFSFETIANYICSDNDVVIPARINGVAVRSIGAFAFRDKNLSSVTIPNSVTNIDWGAFEDNNLSSVTIPDSVTSIGISAFEDNNLTSVNIPDSVTNIQDFAFEGNNLSSVSMNFRTRYVFSGPFLSFGSCTVANKCITLRQ